MQPTHLWICGTGRGAPGPAVAPEAAITVDCHRRLRGPYTGTGSLMRALVPRVHASRPELAARHAIEILAVAPELVAVTGPAPETLTSVASREERTRWYSRYRTRRIAHGITDFLRECAAADPLTLVFYAAGHADPTDQEFLSIALRRLDPARVRLVVCSGAEVPGLGAALARYARHEAASGPGARLPSDESGLAAAFVASDGTSDSAPERAAYLRAEPGLRAQLHDARAAELASRGEWSLSLGAIPHHLEHGSSPGAAGADACATAIDYCIGMGFYHAGLELAGRLARLTDPGSRRHHLVRTQICQCLALLERPAEAEPVYHDLLSQSPVAERHMSIRYALAMLYTRVYGPERKDHRRALAELNTAVAIAGLLEDPAQRAFHSVFMNNGRALVEMHLGNHAESLRLVDEGISRLDRELPPDRHLLHRSVLYHNRAQVLSALGRPAEALADLGRVIAADSRYPEYHFDRGNLLSKLGRYADALASYEEAIRLTPPFPELYYNRGDARSATGDTDGAMADFRYVLDLEPDNTDARVSLSALLLDAGDARAAAAEARAGLAETPDEARLHCALGLALLDLPDYQAAAQAFGRALELAPGLPEALVNRAVAAYELGQHDAAVADLTTALEADRGNPDLLFNRAVAQEAAGRPADALADYTLALADERADRAEILYRRGRCCAALGQLAGARADLAAHLALGTSAYQEEISGLLETCRAGTP